MQASVKEGRGSVPLCASHRRGAIAPLRIAAPAKCLDCCKRSSAFPVWLVCPSITGCKQLARRSAFEGRLQSACVPAADRLPIARPLLLDCFWSVMSQFHGSSVCAWYSVVFCSLAFLQVRDWCDDLCQYAHVAAAICDTLLLPPIFALCTAPRVPMPLLKEDTRAAQGAIDKLLDPELLFGTPSPHGAFSSSSAVQ